MYTNFSSFFKRGGIIMVVFLTSSFVDYQAPENEYRPLPIVPLT